MAGVTAKIQDKQFQRRMAALIQGAADASPLMKIWGEIAHASILENFEVGGRPAKWAQLSKVTIKLKGHARPLIGRTGNLRRIVVVPQKNKVLIGTSPATKDYAARQQFGWPGGGARYGGKVKTPARPFILLQPEDRTEMDSAGRDYLKRLGEP